VAEPVAEALPATHAAETYSPASQLSQAVNTVSAVTIHAVDVYLFADEAVHAVQDATLEAVEKVLPPAHAVHVLAPVPTTPVTEPALHVEHDVVETVLAAAAT
jgi:hypothetical protein